MGWDGMGWDGVGGWVVVDGMGWSGWVGGVRVRGGEGEDGERREEERK